jgi:hypothetical protein
VAALDWIDELEIWQTRLITRRYIIVAIDAVGARLMPYQKQYAATIINLLGYDAPYR